MTRMILAAGLPLALCLSACGDHLGDYRLEEVQVVREIPAEALEGRSGRSTAEYIRIELSSEQSLYAANTGPGLYTDADLCPMNNPDRLIAFGPVAGDGQPVEDYRREEELKPGHDGRYRYFVYIAPSSPPRKLFSNSDDVIPAYDVRKQNADICLRFYVPGYNIIPSQSITVRIESGTVTNAPTA